MTRAKGARPVALITGASAGIGAAYADALAARGYDLVVVARDPDRLETAATRLRDREGCEVECLSADLAREDGIRSVALRIARGGEIDLLVNNAGRGSFGPFWEREGDDEVGQTLLNAVAPQRLSHAALRRWIPRQTGALVFVSSLSGFQPSPYSSTYGATKAFLNSFAHALREELRGSGVRVQLLCPGFTRTEFQTRAAVPAEAVPRMAWTGAEDVVASSLRALARDRFLCTPGAFSKGLGVLMRIAPHALARRVAGRTIRPLLKPRA